MKFVTLRQYGMQCLDYCTAADENHQGVGGQENGKGRGREGDGWVLRFGSVEGVRG